MLALCRTILELVRDMATDLVADGARVKVCVQQALGQGVFQVRASLACSSPDVASSGVRHVKSASERRAMQGADCTEPRDCAPSAQGLPLSLSGVRRIMDNMDWGEALDFVSFGHVNPDQLDDSDFYILVAPQNVVASPIILNLIKMVGSY